MEKKKNYRASNLCSITHQNSASLLVSPHNDIYTHTHKKRKKYGGVLEHACVGVFGFVTMVHFADEMCSCNLANATLFRQKQTEGSNCLIISLWRLGESLSAGSFVPIVSHSPLPRTVLTRTMIVILISYIKCCSEWNYLKKKKSSVSWVEI